MAVIYEEWRLADLALTLVSTSDLLSLVSRALLTFKRTQGCHRGDCSDLLGLRGCLWGLFGPKLLGFSI